jgi:hypothetical protein
MPPTLIPTPTRVEAAGNKPKLIDEFVGRVNTQTPGISIARMVDAGQAVLAPKGEWVRYSTPGEAGAHYVAICLPAFSPDTVHRDDA